MKDFRGRKVVLFFFPKADTPGCTIEASGFRDADHKIQETGAVVLGISADSVKQQKAFKDKYGLTYSLLSDPEKTVCQAFGVLKEKNMYGKSVLGIERTTFIIDAKGNVERIFPKVKIEGHVQEVLAALQ